MGTFEIAADDANRVARYCDRVSLTFSNHGNNGELMLGLLLSDGGKPVARFELPVDEFFKWLAEVPTAARNATQQRVQG